MLNKLMISFLSIFLLLGAISAHAKNSSVEQQQILQFWFDADNQQAPLYSRAMWWKKDEQVDNEIRKQFTHLREKAIDGKLNDWLNTPKGTLAYIILIDQFSRNLYRNSPAMFQHDKLALNAAKSALDKGFDQQLPLTERVFIYLPLEHSENIDNQNQSVALFEKLDEQTPTEFKDIAGNYLNYAKDHQHIIKRFGRFPHRNKILNRESTLEEIEFMKTHSGY